jgi:membrane protease YdiL (CAAX protease family)
MTVDRESRTLTQRQHRAVGLAIVPTAILLTLNGLYLDQAQRTSSALFWILDLTQFILVPVVSFWALWRFASVRPADYGLSRLSRRRTSFGALAEWAIVLFVFLVGGAVAKVLASFVPDFWGGVDHVYGNAIPTRAESALAAITYLSFSAAVVEEVVYRGLPLLYLSTGVSPAALSVLYPTVSAVGFAAIHWENGSYEVVAAFLLGLVLAALYVRIKNLWPFVFGHVVSDLLLFTGHGHFFLPLPG